MSDSIITKLVDRKTGETYTNGEFFLPAVPRQGEHVEYNDTMYTVQTVIHHNNQVEMRVTPTGKPDR